MALSILAIQAAIGVGSQVANGLTSGAANFASILADKLAGDDSTVAKNSADSHSPIKTTEDSSWLASFKEFTASIGVKFDDIVRGNPEQPKLDLSSLESWQQTSIRNWLESSPSAPALR